MAKRKIYRIKATIIESDPPIWRRILVKPNISPDNAFMLGNKGYTLYLLGRTEEAEPVLRRALELGGQNVRDAELEDADIHPLPQDEAFKELIHRLWTEVSGNN